MLRRAHLGDEVGDVQQPRRRVAAGDADVLVARALLQKRDDFGDVEIFVAQGDVQLVEQHEVELRIEDHLAAALPGLARGGDVALRDPARPR